MNYVLTRQADEKPLIQRNMNAMLLAVQLVGQIRHLTHGYAQRT